ncbi:Hsp70 family protein [Dactylosporangium sp. NPDC005572]|uniref:Hsp70 family protein n=1 Tax=Dactylosporangium sp. NPDC005572 TaxID=3156889 RepID=UPI0033B0ADDF
MVDVQDSHSPIRLSIDFGALHTVAVICRAGQQPRTLLFDGSPLLPSGVYAGPDGVLHTGRDAERLAQIDPAGFEPHPKRSIDHERVLLGTHEYAPVALIGAVMARVAGAAAEAGAGPLAPLVPTCPAGWGPRRRAVLVHSARQAGFRVAALIDEPVAAATYCLSVLDVAVGPPVAVFDLGGGTLDIALLRREPGGLQVLSTGGLGDLGGLDVDAVVVTYLGQLIAARDPALWQRLERPTDTDALRDRQAFWAEVREAKEMLSRTGLTPAQLPGGSGTTHLTRDELDRLAEPLVDRAVDEFIRLLRDTHIEPFELTAVFLVGGASRMPLVARRLHTRLGVPPTVPEQPELPVAFGALQAVDTGPIHPAVPAAGRTRRGTLATAALAIAAVLIAGVVWRDAGRRPHTGIAAQIGPSASSSPPPQPAATSPAPTPPVGYIACDGGRLCPTAPICWLGSLVYTQTNVAVLRKDCAEPHGRETFMAGYQPSGTGSTLVSAVEALQNHPDIKQLCALSVLQSRLRDPATSGPWEILALPMPGGVIDCIASRSSDNRRTGSLFRTGFVATAGRAASIGSWPLQIATFSSITQCELTADSCNLNRRRRAARRALRSGSTRMVPVVNRTDGVVRRQDLNRGTPPSEVICELGARRSPNRYAARQPHSPELC